MLDKNILGAWAETLLPQQTFLSSLKKLALNQPQYQEITNTTCYLKVQVTELMAEVLRQKVQSQFLGRIDMFVSDTTDKRSFLIVRLVFSNASGDQDTWEGSVEITRERPLILQCLHRDLTSQ